jgi:hypothetical protein
MSLPRYHEPSLVVDPRKQPWNCLGACREGGDVYKSVMNSRAWTSAQPTCGLAAGTCPRWRGWRQVLPIGC